MTKPTFSVGMLIRQLREAAGLSTHELARASGVDQSAISRLEAGRILEPRPDKLSKLAAALDADAADLYAAAGYATTSKLPSFQTYLRTKYGHLPAAQRAELSAYFDSIEAEYGKTPKQH